MGLAASQARFLAITSRKASCEYESMNIAQQKLSLTRQLAEATKEYQSSLNKTKLVWGMSDGLSAANPGQTYDLSYDVMMTPSALNSYEPSFITTRNGKIVLNSKMAAAATKAGIDPDRKTNPDMATYHKFLQAMGVQGYLSTSQVATLTDTATASQFYNSKSGIGGEPIDKTQASAKTLSTLINYINKERKDRPDYGSVDIGDKGQYIYSNSSKSVSSLSIADILSNNIVYAESGKDGNSILEVGKQLVKNMINSMKGLLAEDIQSSEALKVAESEINTLLSKSPVKENGGLVAEPKLAEKSGEYNTFIYDNAKFGDKTTYAINLSNILKSFLTFYAQALGNYDTDYVVRDRKADSVYVTSDPNYYYILKNENAITEKDLLVADFYSNMFNNICTAGWTTSSGDIDSKEYLSHAIKNGQLFVSSMGGDYNYYQQSYSLNNNIMEITDEDGIAMAEAEYNAKKNQLNYKEEQLDLDMKNIDTELSALTTEYDSVKNLISKNVEKVFTMFSS